MNASLIEFGQDFYARNQQSVADMLSLLPNILLAISVFIFGWLLGYLVQHSFRGLAQRTRIDELLKKIGFNEFVEKAKFKSHPLVIVGKFIKGIIIIFFLRQSLQIIGWTQVEQFIGAIIEFIPNLVIALLIVLMAIQFSQTLAFLAENMLSFGNEETRKIIGIVAKNIIIVFGIMAAVLQLNISAELTQMMQTIFTAFAAMLALAGGLALGLGSKDFVANALKKMQKK